MGFFGKSENKRGKRISIAINRLGIHATAPTRAQF